MIPVDVVVKIGGGVLAYPELYAEVLAAVAAAAHTCRLVIVPGGGPFADTVREADHRLGLTDAAAHWMAVLAMDQHAHLITSRVTGAVLVEEPGDIGRTAARVRVLAPYRWLRLADPLPHCWDVTSDSIAAWVAGALGASRLVLVKPPGAAAASSVDRFFGRALPSSVDSAVVPADRLDLLREALSG